MAESALTAAQEQQILDLLGECVVVVRAGGSTGTGFFVAAGQVLTCRHVVEPAIRAGAPIAVTYGPGPAARTREVLEATVRASLPAGWPDVAILDVPAAADSRCVVIDSGPVTRGTPLLTAGYPAKAMVQYQVQCFDAGEFGRDNAGNQLLRITGDIVATGMSGSPVVNLQSGLVCGVLSLIKSTSALSGFATLFSDFIDQFPSLGTLNDQPPEAAQGWLRILTATQLKNAGRLYGTGARWGTEVTSSRERPTLGQQADILSVVSGEREVPAPSVPVGTGSAPATAVPAERSRDSNNRQAKLFISYSHRDERYLNRLEIHLATLRREGAVIDWHDQMIMPGEHWKTTISDSLESADCVLLLITPDFIASDYCYSVEMERALERHREGHTLVLPVIVRAADWEHTPLGELQALPKNGKPIVEWPYQDRAWLDVTRGLRRILLHSSQ